MRELPSRWTTEGLQAREIERLTVERDAAREEAARYKRDADAYHGGLLTAKADAQLLGEEAARLREAVQGFIEHGRPISGHDEQFNEAIRRAALAQTDQQPTVVQDEKPINPYVEWGDMAG